MIISPMLIANDILERRSQLSPAKRILLEKRVSGGFTGNSKSHIPRQPKQGLLPPSFGQQRLWFVDQLEPKGAVYNRPAAVRLRGPLNLHVLEQSLNEIIERHEVLRTTFSFLEGQLAQLISPSVRLNPSVVDLSCLSQPERETEAVRLVNEESLRPFDLAQGPLLRMTLLRVSKDDHILLLVVHHIVFDAWSVGVLFRELGLLYEAFSAGKPSPLPELPIQYADFALWQRNYLQGAPLEINLAYWRQQLGGRLPVLQLPTDRPRPAIRTYLGARHSLVFPKALIEALKALSRREEVTLFMTLLAAFTLLLSRHTGQEDILVEAPIAGRNRAETEALIGFFVNTLVLRTDLSGDPSFRELLGRVRKVALGAYEHQDLPFEKLVEELKPERPVSYRPLVQVALNLRRAPRSSLDFAELTVSQLEVNRERTDLDLTLECLEDAEGFSAAFEYNRELFDAATIARMAEHFRTLLERIISTPEQHLSELTLFTGRISSRLSATEDHGKGTNDFYEHSNLTKDQLLRWVGQKLWPDVPIYNIAYTFTISSEIKYEHFQKAFQTLINSSDALRTVIQEIDGAPQQRAVANFPYTVEYLDLSHVSNPDAELQAWVSQRCRIPFDFEKCLFDCALIRIQDKKYVWYFSQHHIVSDGTSFSLIHRNMSELYGHSLKGCLERTIVLPPFRDYVSYLREYLGSPRHFESETYWKQKVSENPDPLMFYGKTPLKQTTRVRRIAHTLDCERTQKLRDIAVQEGVFVKTTSASLFNIFAAILSTYLYRISGNRKLSLGTPFHNRSSKTFKETIGLFMQVLPLHIAIEEEDTFLSLINKIRVETSATLQHRPFVIPNSLHKKAYDVLLNYYPAILPDFNGAPMKQEWLHSGHENIGLSVQIANPGSVGNFSCYFDFHYDFFPEEQFASAIQHFLRVLDAFLENPAQPLRYVKLLWPEQERYILEGFNQTRTTFPEDQTVVQLFEAQARKTPDQTAIIFEDQSLTYAQLNARSNQVAHYLRSLEVQPDTLVGIWMERSLEMVVGQLGILKAGGAYVPLDPAFPNERLAFMMEDADVRVLLTQQNLIAALPPHSARIVALDSDWKLIASQSDNNPGKAAIAENLAYVIYTSGSTGKPKGVQVGHRALTNFLCSVRQDLGITSGDVLLSVTTPSFDMAALEIYLPLITGAQLVIVSREVASDGPQLKQRLTDSSATVMQATPATWGMLIDGGWDGGGQLKILCGGESLHRDLANQLLARSVALWNVYGPTETTIWSTKCKIESPGTKISIGRPIANTQVYLLDDNLQPVPIGVPGEMYVGGEGLARGYLNRPELTAEKFIPDPFSSEQGARLYKTGDLSRYLPSGEIEFIGRIDHQVKIRGYRIELGEIEVILSGHETVNESVVIAREDLPGDKRLVGYVVGEPGQTVSISELRTYLQEKLPDYMVPAAFVRLEKLPLTRNGKVDRKALPAPDSKQLEQEHSYVGPRTAMEELLAGIWGIVLGIRQIGVHDDFFNLGGHSLLATQIISRVRRTFEVELPLRALFVSPTIAGLAELIETARREHQKIKEPPLIMASKREKLPLSFAQQRLWFLDQLEPNNPFYNVSQAIRVRGSLDTRALAQAIDTIISRHESLRTTFQSVDGWTRQIIAERLTMELHIRDLNHLGESERETEARRLASEEARRPFDLAAGPLMRASLLRLTEDDHVLLLTMHHIISDGWSLGILTRELGTLYEAYSAGQPSPLPELLIQYADYALWQREWLQGEVLEKQLAYWRERLGSELPFLALPADRPRPAVQTYGGSRQSIELPMRLVEQLRQLSQREEATLYMLCLAAFQMLMSRYSGQDDIIVGSPIAGRNRAETEGLIGFFVNTLVMRTDLSGNPTFRELLGRVKEMTLGAYEHQDLPFEKLVEELQPERSLSYSPLFQVLFALQNAPSKAAALGQLKLDSFGIDNRTTRFDLEVHLGETADGKLSCTFVHNTDLFDAATVRRMITHYQTLLESVVANPEEQIWKLEVLTGEELEQLLVEWNDTRADYLREQTINQLFEAQVLRTPDAVAVVYDDKQLTYRQLNERANQLAHYLQKLGVGPEVLVAISVDRSLEMVIGLLGILKAGGAYVPLDPDYPRERLSFILEDARASVLLTQARLLENLPARAAQTVCLDRDWETISGESRENPKGEVRSNNLAYIIYTSGSTGRPKGVAIEHRSTVALVQWTKSVFSEEDLKGVLASTSICFDLSVFELFVTLSRGGRIIMAEDALQLMELEAANEVTLINTVPSAVAELVRVRGIPATVRTVNLAGEPLHQSLVDQLYEQESIERVFDLYGPSEDTTYSTYALRRRNGHATIGRPIANTQVYILDKEMQPVPVGVAGELHLGGEGLARGYLNRPELTREKFIGNPFSSEPEARVYKTGDLARYLPDGNIEFLGRIDHQVKVRGYRIELGEIETALEGYPGIEKSVVMAREDQPGNKRLVAYVVPRGEERVAISELRGYLIQHLPEYMVPAFFVVLEKLPLTPNGKIDRQALQAPDESRPEIEVAFVTPRTASEEVLTKIWGEILGLQQVGVFDNFFELGGHSLLATQVISRINDAFEIRVPLRDFFERPTVAGLADLMSGAKKRHWEAIPAIRRLPRD